MKNWSLIACLMLSLMALTACGDDEAAPAGKAAAERPEVGKADSLKSVQELVTMSIGDDFEHEFTEDFAFFGFPILVQAGSNVTFEVTQRGSSRGLDTTLFIYGEKDGDWEELAYDDDEGWGSLSRIKGFTLPEGYSRYQAIVSTYGLKGRGNFRVSLECADDSCESAFDPDLLTFCDPVAVYYNDACMLEAASAEGALGFQYREERVLEFAQTCAEPVTQESLWKGMCEEDNVGFGIPEFCKAGFDAYLEVMVPDCTAHTLSAYGVSPTHDITRQDLPTDLEQKLQDYACTEAEGCSRTIELLNYTSAPSSEITGYVRREILDQPYAYTAEYLFNTRPGFEPLLFEEDVAFFNEQILPTLGFEDSSVLTHILSGNFEDADGKPLIIIHVIYDFITEGTVMVYSYSGYTE